MVSPRGITVLIQDPDGAKRYSSLDTTGISIGRFDGSIDSPSSFTSDTYMTAGAISDGKAYSGIVTADGKRFVISGGLIRSVQ